MRRLYLAAVALALGAVMARSPPGLVSHTRVGLVIAANGRQPVVESERVLRVASACPC